MESDESNYLYYVLRLFHEPDKKRKICDLEGWTLEQIHEIEAANIVERSMIRDGRSLIDTDCLVRRN